MANYYSYMRISTKIDRDKQSYTRQESALAKYAENNKIEYVFQFKEDVTARRYYCIQRHKPLYQRSRGRIY